MTNKKRVVLSLKQEHAEELDKYLMTHGGTPMMMKIHLRLERTLTKQKLLEKFQEQGIKPTKENLKTALKTALGESNGN